MPSSNLSGSKIRLKQRELEERKKYKSKVNCERGWEKKGEEEESQTLGQQHY